MSLVGMEVEFFQKIPSVLVVLSTFKTTKYWLAEARILLVVNVKSVFGRVVL